MKMLTIVDFHNKKKKLDKLNIGLVQDRTRSQYSIPGPISPSLLVHYYKFNHFFKLPCFESSRKTDLFKKFQ